MGSTFVFWAKTGVRYQAEKTTARLPKLQLGCRATLPTGAGHVDENGTLSENPTEIAHATIPRLIGC